MTAPTEKQVADAARVLGKASLYDPRMQAGDIGMAAAWAEALAKHRIDVGDALAAVVEHYATSRERIMPADVIRLARTARTDRAGRTIGSDTAPPTEALSPATVEARRKALAAAAASIGQAHRVDTPKTFDAAPARVKPVSQLTIAEKVARVRAAGPPQPMPADDEIEAQR